MIIRLAPDFGAACQAQHLLRAGSQFPRAIQNLTEGKCRTTLHEADVALTLRLVLH